MPAFPIHQACSAWPAMSDDALRDLAADIRAHGQRVVATISPEGELLDGRTRMAACEFVGVELKTFVHDGDPVAFSISKNKHRRHMDKIGLAFVGAELANLANGTNRHVAFADAKARIHVASELGIATDAIDNAKAIIDRGTPEVIALAKSKRIGLRAAADYTRHTPKHKQIADPKTIKGGTRTLRRDEGASRDPRETGERLNRLPSPNSGRNSENERAAGHDRHGIRTRAPRGYRRGRGPSPTLRSPSDNSKRVNAWPRISSASLTRGSPR